MLLLKIISPEQVLFKGEVEKVTLPGTLGLFMVLENHAPLASTLLPGHIVYTGREGEQTVSIRGGVVNVVDNEVIVCVE